LNRTIFFYTLTIFYISNIYMKINKKISFKNWRCYRYLVQSYIIQCDLKILKNFIKCIQHFIKCSLKKYLDFYYANF